MGGREPRRARNLLPLSLASPPSPTNPTKWVRRRDRARTPTQRQARGPDGLAQKILNRICEPNFDSVSEIHSLVWSLKPVLRFVKRKYLSPDECRGPRSGAAAAHGRPSRGGHKVHLVQGSGFNEVHLHRHARSSSHPTESVHKVDLQKSIPAQIRQLILDISYNEDTLRV